MLFHFLTLENCGRFLICANPATSRKPQGDPNRGFATDLLVRNNRRLASLQRFIVILHILGQYI